MSIISGTRDFFWYWGFRAFCEFRHPLSGPFKIVRRIMPKTDTAKSFASHAEPRVIPKKIWIYWAQGWDAPPPVVQLCRESWIQKNPDWRVIVINKDSISEYLTLGAPFAGKEVSHAAYSDIARIGLLSKYGGVWADATTFCSASLDSWLPAAMRSGFFAFYKPKTTIASWFLAVEKDNQLMRRWEEYVACYWKYAEKPNRYFWVHYLFEYLIRNDAAARAIWNDTPHVSSVGPYAAQRCLKGGGDVAMCASIIESGIAPVHKLDWKMSVPEDFLQGLKTAIVLAAHRVE